MKTHRTILFFSILLFLSTCNYHSKDIISYFEVSSARLYYMTKNLEEKNRILKDEIHTQTYPYLKNVEIMQTNYKKIDKMRKKIKNLFYYFDFIYLFKNTEKKRLNANNNIIVENNVKTTKHLFEYLEFLEKNYSKFLTDKIKLWQNQKKDFFENQFEGLPIIGARAKFSQMRIELLQQENIILKYYYDKIEKIIESEITKIKDCTNLIFIEEKNKIKLGETYKAKAIVAFSQEKPDMILKIDDKEVPIKNGIGKLSFRANSLGKKSHRASVTFKYFGKDSTVKTERIQYEVVPKK